MRKGIGPNNLGAAKSPAKMYGAKSPAKQTKMIEDDKSYKPTSLGGFGGPRFIAQGAKKAVEAAGNALGNIDASLESRMQKSSRKPSAKAGSMQDFMNRGPIGFVKNLNRSK